MDGGLMVPGLAQVLPELPRLAQECYAGPWAYEYEDCRATLTKIGDVTVVSIPGTHGAQDLGDLLADGLLAVKFWNISFGWCPEGSVVRATGLYEQLAPVLTGPVVVTGHSLGGAFGQVLAGLMKLGGTPPVWLETYGAPHSAGARMVNILDSVNGRAYENHGDPIPEMTGRLWGTWWVPVLLGDPAAAWSIQRHFIEEYRALLAPAVAA